MVSTTCSVEWGNVAPMIANAIIAKSDIFGVILPSNISTGMFVQVAGDKL